MPESVIFLDYLFILVPKLVSKSAIVKRQLYEKQGAKCFYNLSSIGKGKDQKNSNDKVVIVLQNYKSLRDKINKDFLVKCLDIEYDDRSFSLKSIVLKYPIVKNDWIVESLKAGKVLPLQQFAYDISHVRVDSEISQDYLLELSDRSTKARKISEIKNQDGPATKQIKLEDTDELEKALASLSNREKFKRDNQDNDDEDDEDLLADYMAVSKNVSGPNKEIIFFFNKMANEYKQVGESYKYVNYRKAINTISKLDYPLKTYDEAIKLPNIGKSLALKIEEINKTHKLSKLFFLQNDIKYSTLNKFMKIYSVGPTIAKNWYDRGYRTIEDIEKKVDNLTSNQKLGIKYYNDWNSKIPREEVTQHYEFVKNIALKEVDSKLEIFIMGSYRRGLPECGDIDILITKKNCNDKSELAAILSKLISRLKSKDHNNYIQCSLIHSGINSKSLKFYGGCLINENSKCRRIDFLMVPYEELGASLIYFTGNDIFNRIIRTIAIKKGLNLSNIGLTFKKTGEKCIENSHDEKTIFDYLGIKYRNPEDRNIGY
ncbi:hypothetical protein PACTADRAFT_33910 [Pachysolen tannophilus NRRL Y-2460]|uniref:DNA polymerase n=1 Tax=Pachysolen tannophilus NRRL Y-2460 TaxID=669874 RepID=A0A1E4TUK0_PACTA|nr:hypothetical protein PACTADRAFT_33910 [Pachysolen tannophilus NRRL Y-2460]